MANVGIMQPNDNGPIGHLPGTGAFRLTNSVLDRWLSVDEIADYLGIKRDAVYKWIDRKAMPAHKVGSLWKFQKVEIDNWVFSGQASDQRATHAKSR